MITIRFSGRMPTPSQAVIGMETDSRAEKIRFQLPQISEGQTAQMMMLLPDGTPDMVLLEDGMADIPASLTEIPGRIRAWVEILGDEGEAWNSELFYLDVGDLPPVSEKRNINILRPFRTPWTPAKKPGCTGMKRKPPRRWP